MTNLSNAAPGGRSDADGARVPGVARNIDGRRAGGLSGVLDGAVRHTLPGQACRSGSGLELLHLLLGSGDVGEMHQLGLLAGAVLVLVAVAVGGTHATIAHGRSEDLVGGVAGGSGHCVLGVTH